MKLFDRSVNLAKFEENTSLYPLVRAWMENCPRKITTRSDKNKQEAIDAADDDVIELPNICIRNPRKHIERNGEKTSQADFDKIIDSEVWNKDKILDFHRTRWQNERKLQLKSSKQFEEKYFSANLQLIESLIKDAEE